MEQVVWQIRNFTAGAHTEPGRVGEGSERFAREVSGLRVDANGHLRPRVSFRQYGEPRRSVVTGVASAQDYLLLLRSDGTLWHRFSAQSDAEWAVQFRTPLDGVHASPMTGMLSLIGDFEDFALVKGQGGSPFWIDMREEAPTYRYAYRLGLEPPSNYPQLAFFEQNRDADDIIVPPNHMVFWRWTYVRAFGRTTEEIRRGVLYQRGELFNGMESNPSPAVGVTRSIIHPPVVDGEGREVTALSVLSGGKNEVAFTGFQHTDDPQVSGIMLYQSAPVPVATRRVGASGNVPQGRINVDALAYRRVAYLPKGDTQFTYPNGWTDDLWTESPSLRFDNDVLPETERVVLYNDRLFCPTFKGLRYSDIDGTALRLWAFPEVNAISRSGIKDLVAHRGVLLFGGPTDFHSLAGTSAFNFAVQRLGTTGPVSPHAMDVFRDTVAFVGAAGFYATDGVGVQKLSDALNSDFEDYQATSGHCHMLPDDSLIFIIQQSPPTGRPRKRTYHFDGGWFHWPRLSVRQITRWESDGVQVMLADESNVLRELRWNRTGSEYDDDGKDSTDLIDWSWESERLNFGSERVKQFREFQLEGQALSVVPQKEARFGLTRGTASIRRAFAWRIGSHVFAIGGHLWGTASVAARVRLTVWIDEGRPHHEVFELRRDDEYPFRIPINRRGRSIRIRLEGRGHVHLRAMRLIGAV